MHATRRPWLAAVLALLLAACGGAQDGATPAAASAADAAGDDTRAATLATSAAAATAPQRWSDPATWGGTPPVAGANVVVPRGRQIVLDTATPALRTLVIEGELVSDPARDVAITADGVLVRGGRLAIGTAAVPHRARATITLTGTTRADLPGFPGFGSKVLGQVGGTLELHGRPVGRAWTRLAGGDVQPGARRLVLAEAPGWQAGDRIVVATSSPDPAHHDVAEIESVDGAVVTLRTGLRFAHFGAVRTVDGRAIDVRAAVGLLSRNVVVQGDANSEALRTGGHAMFMAGAAGAAVRIAGVEFARMGQLNAVGRYPLHFHVMGDGCRTCYVRDSTVRDTIQRGLVLHDTRGVTVAGNVLFNTVGHNLVVETAETTGNVIDRNLALVNRQPNPLHTEPTLVSQMDRLPSNFWFRSGRNQVTNNVAAGSRASGFNYDGIGSEPIDFRGNTAHAALGQSGAGEGVFDIFGGLLIATDEPRPADDRIEDVLVFHNAFGLWPEENGVLRIRRFVAAENGIGYFGRGVGNRVHLSDGLFVGRLPGSSRDPGRPLQYVYGSDTVFENVAFAGWNWMTMDVADTGPTQSMARFAGTRLVGPRPRVTLGDAMTWDFDDDGFLPRGHYVTFRSPWLATAACERVVTDPLEPDDSVFLRCPRRYGAVELDVRSAAGGAYGTKVNPYLVRSDGVRYRRAEGDAGVGTGMHGTTVLHDAGFTYRIDAASPGNGWAVRLAHEALPWLETSNRAQALRVDVSIPMTAPPRGVFRTGDRFERPNAPLANQALRSAVSWADFQADPLGSYLWDPASRHLWVKATGRWVVVTP